MNSDTRVVDLLAYKARRANEPAARETVETRPLRTWRAGAPTPRQIAHRQRMLLHLAAR